MYREIPYNFGALPMPDGYSVAWYECHEHYQAIGPDDWESAISVDPHQCRRLAILHAKQAADRQEAMKAVWIKADRAAKEDEQC